MKKILFALTLSILCVSLSGPVMAQVYKYETESGQVFYTNDYNQVPNQYRDQISQNQEFYDRRPIDDPAAQEEDTKASGTDADIEGKRQQLEQTRAELSQTYADLNAKQKELEEKRANIEVNDKAALEIYNNDIIQLNEQIEAYTKRSDEHKQAVQDFNKMVMEINGQ